MVLPKISIYDCQLTFCLDCPMIPVLVITGIPVTGGPSTIET